MQRFKSSSRGPSRGRAWGSCAALLLLSLAARKATAGAQYQTTADWGSGFNGQITVTNPGAALTGWRLEFDFAPRINNIWDAQIESRVGNHYVIKSVGWNDTIGAGGQISFGFGGAPGNVKAGPTNFVLRGSGPLTPTPTPKPVATSTPKPAPTSTPVPAATATPVPGPNSTPTPSATPIPNGVRATITQTGRWNGGFGADLEIANGTAQTVNGWTLRFDFVPQIDSLWNGTMTRQGSTYTVRNESWNGTIAPGGSVKLGFGATGELSGDAVSNGTFNGTTCAFTVVLGGGNPNVPGPSNGITIGGGVDANREALQITIAQGVSSFPLTLSNGSAGTFAVAANNPAVVAASIVNGALQLTGLKAGRAGLRIGEAGGAARYVGVRVREANGALPGWPSRMVLGSVSEDTDDHLNFWHGFGSGATNRYVDARYIYLNGGPQYGWATWTNTPGGRAINYIRESKKLGMIPIFVWYNIPDGGESYTTDLEHIGSAAYMKEYYKLLKLFLDVVKAESPDEPVGIILEPDFLGYMAQNAGKPASQIGAFTSAAYDIGYLKAGVDPAFPNTIQGLVQSVNYLISRETPQATFGWQMNLWASPAGGWTTPIPGTGLMHLSDNRDITTARTQIYNEARAITQYYVDAGIKSYGADFVSIDKYGLDAATAEASAAQDPAASTWFWNCDQWNNYLVFVRAMHETSNLPVVLWQLPVGHINSSRAMNPYDANRPFPDLTNNNRQGEDSAPTFFFGDTFVTQGKRFTHFAQNRGGDAATYDSSGAITWGEHFTAAANAGVTMALFGAGVGGSTTNVGTPPSDSQWWIVKAQKFLAP